MFYIFLVPNFVICIYVLFYFDKRTSSEWYAKKKILKENIIYVDKIASSVLVILLMAKSYWITLPLIL